MSVKQHAVLFFKGAATGGSMMLPGISGGTCAIILGIYDRLIKAVSNLLSDFKQNVVFLLIFGLGGISGVLLLSGILSYAMQMWGFFLTYLFMGAVAGTVPLIYKQAGTAKFRASDILFTAIGTVMSLAVMLIPDGMLNVSGEIGGAEFLLLLVAGVVIAAALVLPGISVSYMLLIFGIYDRVVNSLSSLDIAFLLPLGVGGIIGIFLTAKALDKLFENHKRAVYMAIGGFVISSIPQIFPGLAQGTEMIACVLVFAVGFAAVMLLSLKTGFEK